MHAVVVAGELRVGFEVVESQRLAKRRPLRIAHGGQKNLLTVFHSEHVVHRPGRDARRHGRGRLAGDGVLQHVLAHQKHVVLEQRALHLLPLARDAALDQRAQGADGAEHAAHDVVDAAAGTQRVTGAPGHVGQAAHHLHHFIECGAVLIGSRQKALVADIDQARIDLGQRSVVESVFAHGAGLEVLGHHVGAGSQLARHFGAGRVVQINRNAFLVAVEHREKTGTGAQQMARAVAVNRLDLDHLGAHVGQHHAASGAHDHVGEFDHAQAGQGQGLGRDRRVVHDA